MATPEEITVTVFNFDGSVRSKTFSKNGNPHCNGEYGTDYFEFVSAGADDIRNGKAKRMDVK